MGKYSFRLYLVAGDIKDIKLSNSNDISDFDRYVEENNGLYGLSNKLADMIDVSTRDITKITIVRNVKGNELEYSLVSSNPYLTPVIDKVENKKILSPDGRYQINAVTIPMDNPNYIEMKKYLFDNIKDNYKQFLNYVYKYNNEFSKLLYKYGSSYNDTIYNEETEEHNIKDLQRRIEIGLSIYSNFRTLCIARSNNESKLNYSVNKKPNKQGEVVKPIKRVVYSDEDIELEKEIVDKLNRYVNANGEEKEEFLDSDEIASSKRYY